MLFRSVRSGIEAGKLEFLAYVLKNGETKEFMLKILPLTEEERKILLAGCLINSYKS